MSSPCCRLAWPASSSSSAPRTSPRCSSGHPTRSVSRWAWSSSRWASSAWGSGTYSSAESSTSRCSQMPPEILVAAIAAAAVLLITVGISSRPGKDAVQQRLEQLVVQPRSLEEYELQAPFFERTVRPIVKRLSQMGRRADQGGLIARTDAKLEKAGFPGGLRGADWLGVKLLVMIALAVLAFLLGLGLGGPTGGLFFAIVGGAVGYIVPEFWLGRRIR